MVSTSIICSIFSFAGFRNSSNESRFIFYLVSLIFQTSILYQTYNIICYTRVMKI
jgi:hypothetical protein